MPEPASSAWLLKDWLTLVGTIVGFGGVCLTLYVNALIASRKAAADRKNEESGVRTTLMSELLVVQVFLEEWRDRMDRREDKTSFYLPYPWDAEGLSRAYRASLPKLPFLTLYEISAVVNAYSRFENVGKYAQLVNSPQGEHIPFKQRFEVYNNYNGEALRAVDLALQELDKHLNLIGSATGLEAKPAEGSGTGMEESDSPKPVPTS